MNESLTNRMALSESKFLNILRGLAILGVISMHSAESIQELEVQHISEHVSQVLYLGKYGVEVFFFLSGWLLSALYGFNKVKLGWNYFLRRIARIYPLWVIFLLVYILEAYFLQSGGFFQAMQSSTDLKVIQQPAVVTFLALTFTLFLSNNLWNTVIPGGWSIQSEVAHYALFPIFRKQGLHRSAQILAIINLGSVILLLARSKIESVFPSGYSIISTWLRLGAYSTFSFFFIGVLANRYLRRDLHQSDTPFWNSKSFIFFVVTSVCVNCPQGVQIEAIGYLAVNLIVAFALLNDSKLSNLLILLGKYSYFMYFVHFIVLRVIVSELNSHSVYFNFPADQLFVFVFLLATTLCISFLLAVPSYKYIEKPLIDVSR